MNNILTLVGRYVRDLLDYDPNLMVEGRVNDELADNNISYIAYDTNSLAQRIGDGESYDGDTEIQNLNIRYSQEFTLSFYGDDAYTNVDTFTLLQKSQAAYDKQYELEISVYLNSGITDLKLLTGSTYNNRLDVTIKILYNKSINISALRIDELQYNLITNK